MNIIKKTINRLVFLTLGAVLMTAGMLGVLVILSPACDMMGTDTLCSYYSDHYKDGKFHNLAHDDSLKSTEGIVYNTIEYFLSKSGVRVPTESLNFVNRSKKEFDQKPASGLRVTWLGHSTALIEIDGKNILTDPVWGNRASPVDFAGPKRFFDCPLDLEELPHIDAVVISHDHYDHLCKDTIKYLADKVSLFVVPLRVGDHLRDWGVDPGKIRELDWWDEICVDELSLVCTPARHFSGRSMFSKNTTLWSSWAIIGEKHSVFFSGDTGMTHSFAEIGERLGPFDVTMIETGAYHPRWSDVHIGPENAVKAHIALKGKILLPIHWGTFNLSKHSWTEPAERLTAAAQKNGVDFAIPYPGESLEPTDTYTTQCWWPKCPWKTAEEAPIH